MKTINSLRSKLLALTLAITASVASFAYEFEYVNDFHIDGFGYKIISVNTPDDGEGYVSLIEIADCKKDVVIPKYVSYGDRGFHVTTFGIGSVVFTNDASSVVESITIPKTIDIINKNALAGCSNLKTVVVDSENPYYDSRENCNAIITTSQNPYITPNTLIAGCKTTIISNSVVEIGENAFYDCESLETITIPNSVTKIGKSTFNACSTLSSITLSENLTEIGNWAFDDCNNLKEVICYAPQPPTISKYTFSDISPTIYVPENTVTIYQNAPYWMTFDIQPIQPSYKSQWCNKWNVMWFDGMRFDETARTSKYRLGKDTIIGDYIYSKFIPGTFVRFTDDRKVYVYHEYFDDHDPYSEDLPTGEYLAYDFSAQVGDTLEVFSGIGTYSTYPCVVDDVQIDSETNLRTMTLHKICRIEEDGFFEEYDDMEMTWIEGVGSPEGFLISYRPCGWVGGGTYALLCAYQGDELKYTGSFYERFGCDYKAGVVSDDLFPTLSGLQRTICREYCEQADNKTRIEQFTNLTTRTETGGPYLYYSPFLLREKDNKILIYSRTLNKDLVLYDFNLQVGDSLPMLYIDFFAKDDWIADRDMEIWCVVDYHKDLEGNILPADTLIVTDVSAITLLDGKEYKKWTFNNGMEYVEGIGSFGNRQWSGDFFQLIANRDVPTSLQGEHLVCVSTNGKLLYQMDDVEMERLGAECLCEVETSYKSQWCDTWNVFVENGSVYPPHEETYRYQLAQDIVIGDYTYTAVVSKAINDALDAPHYVAAVRFTDDRKVYIYYDNAEYLLYDFNVQQGDELEVFAGINNYRFGIKTYKCIVTGVEQYACIGCPANITLHVPNHPDDFTEIYRRTQWQEGVGDVYSGFLNGVNSYVPVDGGGSVHLLCAYQGDELKYTGDLYEEYGCGDDAEQSPEDLFPTLWGLQQTICSGYYGEEGDEWASGLTGPSQEITMMDGKPYLQWGSWYLREENDKILVYSEIQKKDLVLYDFTLELGDTLTTLNLVTPEFLEYEGIVGIVDYPLSDYDYTYPIDTLVVTELSKETLLDGKEYTRWKFSDGTVYVEGIGSMSETFFHHIADHLPVPVSYLGSYLVCVSKNGKLLYQMDDAELERLGAECLCDYDRGPRKDNAKNGKIGGRPTPTQWNQLELDLREMENGNTILRAETFSYTLENDSIVTNGKIFYQLARQSTKDTAITKSFVGALHFGEDEDNRVYFLRDGHEYVLYDFTAEPGDTIEIFAGINNYPQETTYTHVVADKDTTEDGACRMFLEVVFPDETTTATNAEKVWLAGLGSIDGIVHNAAKRTSDAHAAPARSAHSSETQTSVMLCAWREDSCLYTTNHPEYDTFGCVYNQDPTAIESPTSPSSYQKILREGKLMILHNGKIYNVLGVSVK